MIKLIARLVVRNLINQRLYTLLNIAGLTLGLLVFFTILIYVRHQYSFDQFNEQSDRIYRLTSATKERIAAIVPYTWGHQMRNEIAEIENVASFQNITIALTVKQGDDVFAQHGFLGVDSTFLDLFDFPTVSGNKEGFLKSPNKMLITPQTAEKYFGSDNPIGKTLQVNLWGTFVTYEIEGVVDCPSNSHIQFQFLIPIQWVRRHFFAPTAFASWTSHFCHTYFVMSKDFDPVKLRVDMKNFLERHGGESLRDKYTPDVQALEDIYLKSDLRFDFQPRGNHQHVLILLAVAFGIMAMAVINFVNISSAKSLKAVKETSLRKILGSSKRQIFLQFVMESILLTLISTFLAIVGLVLILPDFNLIAGTEFFWLELLTVSNLLLALGMAILIGAFSAIYPALILSSFKPVSILSSRSGDQLKSGWSRKILVVIQFTLAVLLLIATGVIYHQVSFMTTKNLGFDKDQILVLNGARVVAADAGKMELFRSAVTKYEGIQSVTANSSFPGDIESHWSARYLPEGWPADENMALWTIYTDHEFVKTFDLELMKGRDFNRDIGSDTLGLLVNEAAIRHLSGMDPTWLEAPLGKRLVHSGGTKGKVIGVLRDFHFETLKEQLNPLVIQIGLQNAFSIQVKVRAENISDQVAAIGAIWKELFPEIPFDYTFLDQRLAQHFDADKKLGQLLQIVTALSIIIAALGLLGLATFMVYQKSKEMSIRKVIGASEKQLIRLLAWDFLKLILIANLIAIPVGYMVMDQWLDGFAFRTHMPLLVFLLAVGFSLFIASVSVGQQAFKTATQNPVDVLAEQ
ncbi:FtsX-like permease family protein [Reichenbachiella sp.]|uniref:ABC transporter permease n=1 Tax=Reichenbachiella sp. TaxID=2184521 RepID=UPI00329721F0